MTSDGEMLPIDEIFQQSLELKAFNTQGVKNNSAVVIF
jgi:hypothetical protein